MHPFFIKSLLSLAVLLFSLIGVYTMFEIYGRTEKRQNAELLRKVHRINGVAFAILAVFISLMCIYFIYRTKAEPSVRGMLHAILSVFLLVIMVFKILVTNVYRQFYAKLQTAGMVLAILSFTTFAISGGYYLLVTDMGSRQPASGRQPETSPADGKKTSPLIDASLAGRGRELYEDKCTFCHDPLSNQRIVGPGHKGILKNQNLPVSHKPATPENVAAQLREPFRDMPSFSNLTDDEVKALVSYLNTL